MSKKGFFNHYRKEDLSFNTYQVLTNFLENDIVFLK